MSADRSGVAVGFSNIMDSNSYCGSSVGNPLIDARERLLGPAYRLFYDRPVHLVRGRGTRLYDVDGNCYLDAYNNVASVGHCHPAVVEAVARAARDGLSFGACSAGEVEFAELLCQLVPALRGGLVRLVSSGTEATMSALRLARGFTGRSKIVKADGGYHGHADMLLVAAGSGAATLGIPGSGGVPEATVHDTLTVPYNDADAFEQVLLANPGQIAAIIIEPVAGNMGCVPPRPGYLERLAALCRVHGALLILDEVMTGFRVSRSGWFGLEPVDADLFTFGKVMSGGLPAAAFGGRTEVMEHLAPLGPVYQAGTLSGNPVAVAAGLATLRHADADVYAALDAGADRLAGLLTGALSAEGVAHRVQRAGNMLSVFFTEYPVFDFATAQASQTWRFPPFFHAVLDAGVYPPCSAYEAWFVSAALDDAAFDTIAAALPAAARAAAAATDPEITDA